MKNPCQHCYAPKRTVTCHGVCKEYKDVQELLFADPIHEVSEEEGWKPEK